MKRFMVRLFIIFYLPSVLLSFLISCNKGNYYIDRERGNDLNAIFSNPMFQLPNNLNFENPENLSEIDLFKPLPGSPCIGTGMFIPENAEFDFGGSEIIKDLTKIKLGVWQ